MYTVINVQNVTLFCDEWQSVPQLPAEALLKFEKKGPWNEQGLTELVQRWQWEAGRSWVFKDDLCSEQ